MKDNRVSLKVSIQAKELIDAIKSEIGFKNQQEVIDYLLLCFSEEVQNTLTYSKHSKFVEQVKNKRK